MKRHAPDPSGYAGVAIAEPPASVDPGRISQAPGNPVVVGHEVKVVAGRRRGLETQIEPDLTQGRKAKLASEATNRVCIRRAEDEPDALSGGSFVRCVRQFGEEALALMIGVCGRVDRKRRIIGLPAESVTTRHDGVVGRETIPGEGICPYDATVGVLDVKPLKIGRTKLRIARKRGFEEFHVFRDSSPLQSGREGVVAHVRISRASSPHVFTVDAANRSSTFCRISPTCTLRRNWATGPPRGRGGRSRSKSCGCRYRT